MVDLLWLLLAGRVGLKYYLVYIFLEFIYLFVLLPFINLYLERFLRVGIFKTWMPKKF